MAGFGRQEVHTNFYGKISSESPAIKAEKGVEES
jgi:hypothetical protein